MEFEQGHAEKIRGPAGTAEAEFFVESHGALERRSGVEGNASAILTAKFGFDVGEQTGSDSGALAGWEDGHASEVAFALARGLTGDGADDLTGKNLGDEDFHAGETFLQTFRGEYGVEIGAGGVKIAIGCEGGAEAAEDFRGIVVGSSADGDCRKWLGCWHALLCARVRIKRCAGVAKLHFGFHRRVWRGSAEPGMAMLRERSWSAEEDAVF